MFSNYIQVTRGYVSLLTLKWSKIKSGETTWWRIRGTGWTRDANDFDKTLTQEVDDTA